MPRSPSKPLLRSAEWRFLGVLQRAAPGLAASWWGLIAVRGALPAAFTLAMGELVGAVQGGRSLTGPLATAGIVFIALNALGPLHEAIAANLGARAAGWLHQRLLEACSQPRGLAHLEQPDLVDELASARTFDLGLGSPQLQTAMPQIGNGFAEILAGVGQAIVLARYQWWASVLVAGAWASTHVLLHESSLWQAWASKSVVEERRHVEYAYRLAVDAPAAKEIRLFGLAGWVVDRFASRRRRMTEALFRCVCGRCGGA